MSVARAEESATGNVTTGDRAGAGAQAPAPARRRRRRRHDWQGYLYILPAVAVFSLFVLVPLVQTVRLSFFAWDGLTLPRYVGWGNYTQMFRDPLVLQSHLHAVILILFYCVLPVLLGLMLSAVLSRRPLRGFGFFRTVLFLPQVIASVVVGVVWRFIYAPNGPLNQLLSAVGLQRISRAWLSDFTYSLPAIGFVGTWVLTGLCLILILAGIQQIPTDLYDAVRVDGGGAIREFFTVTLPGLRNVVVVCVALTLIAALRTFDLIYVTTRGGPGTSTMVPGLLIYQSAFGDQRDGYAAAIATVLMIVVFTVTFVTLRMSERVK